jgi:ribosome-associated protein
MDDADHLQVTRGCAIPYSELAFRFTRSGGPGGQHANTSDTRVEVSFDVAASPSLLPHQRQRLLERLGPVVTAASSDERSQLRNRAIAVDRLRQRLAEGLRVERPRRPTRPSRSSQRRRVEAKRKQSEKKKRRRPPSDW